MKSGDLSTSRASKLPFEREERETVIHEAIGHLLLQGLVRPGDPLVIINTSIVGQNTFRTVQARTAQV